jgi:protein TonB
MKNVKHTQNSEKAISEHSRKQETNLRKNSMLYFQIGLILCLLGAYTALEYNFESKTYAVVQPLELEEDDTFYVKPFTVVEEQPTKQETSKSEPKVLVEPKIIEDDDIESKETDKIVDAIVNDLPKDKTAVVDDSDLKVEKPTEDPIIPVNLVENVPVYPGCESAGDNKAKLKCMSDKLSGLVQSKFDTDIASENGLSGKQRIFIQFKILKSGEVQFVDSRAPHKALEKEAQRLAARIPAMKPGIQNGRAVEVLYTLPILFQVQN